ncbi:MAG: NUDIX hydrolase [Anaerolineales bacterium]
MRAEYQDIWFARGKQILGEHKAVRLPFKRVSARAMIIRRSDGAILGTLHRVGGRYALPGGAVENGETTLQAVTRELKEEYIGLVDPDDSLEDDIIVDYFEGYGELSVWHMFTVESANIGFSQENVESRWVKQDEDVWYPGMWEKLVLAIQLHLPQLARVSLQVT